MEKIDEYKIELADKVIEKAQTEEKLRRITVRCNELGNLITNYIPPAPPQDTDK